MASQLIDGRALASCILNDVAQRIAQSGIMPCLAAVLVGDDDASRTYVRMKTRAAERVGARVELHARPASTTQSDLEALIQSLNDDACVHGILLQLPLPAPLNAASAIAAMAPQKDADGFRDDARVRPVMAQVVAYILRATGAALTGRHAVIVCNTPAVFAPPLAAALAELGIESTAITPDDTVFADTVRAANIVVSAVGRAHIITADLIAQHAILIDIGITKTADGQTLGDIDPSADAIAAFRTPPVGGVGPLTVAFLLKNLTALSLGRDFSAPNPCA